MDTTIYLPRGIFQPVHHQLVRIGRMNLISAEIGLSASGIHIVRLTNHEGAVEVLPYAGATIWDACFYGVPLGMKQNDPMGQGADPGEWSRDSALLYQAGLFGNSFPGSADHRPLREEMPPPSMGVASIRFGRDRRGHWISLSCGGTVKDDSAIHTIGSVTVTLHSGESVFDVETSVHNRSRQPLALTYAAHAGFDFLPGARIIQPAPFTPRHVQVRSAIPRSITPTEEYRQQVDALGRHPELLELLDPARCDPEQVFHLHDLRKDEEGWVNLGLERDGGDGFGLSYRHADFPYLERRLVYSATERIAGFAIPATCRMNEGTEEHTEGRGVSLLPGRIRRFRLRMGYLSTADMAMLRRDNDT